MTEGEAIMRLSHWASGHWCFPNVHFCACEMDLAVVTRPARLLWEVEIKLTVADWRADARKLKWRSPERSRVSRMFYAVPEEIAEQEPSFVPRETGLLVFRGNTRSASEVRPARLRRAPAVTDAQFRTLLESTHYRFWRERQHRHAQQRQNRKMKPRVAVEGVASDMTSENLP